MEKIFGDGCFFIFRDRHLQRWSALPVSVNQLKDVGTLRCPSLLMHEKYVNLKNSKCFQDCLEISKIWNSKYMNLKQIFEILKKINKTYQQQVVH